VLVPENEMKLYALEPQQNVFDFGAADALVRFAHSNRMQVRGHVLVDNSQFPDWLAQGHFTRDQLIAILRTHILTVVGHFRGQVVAWNVVNEGIANDGGIRDNLWSRVIGPDYIGMAFTWAHQADPAAKLFYNDFGADGINAKSDGIYALVQNLKRRDVPIDGVGLEMHLGLQIHPQVDDVVANMNRFGALGLEVAITELDVRIQDGGGSMHDRLLAQAQIYRDMALACHRSHACMNFITWGFTDRYSWIPQATGHADAPLLFDANYQPKPAYAAVVGVLAVPPAAAPSPSATARP
jgi:endo-1,4-beta-xylanase